MLTVYVYVLDTLADWEIGHVTAELHSRRFFKKNAPQVAVKTVGISKEPVKTMGGLTVIPDCILDDTEIAETSVLLLPGADTWNDPKQADLPVNYQYRNVGIDATNTESLEQRTKNRLLYEEMKRQQNVEAVVVNAYSELTGKETVSEKPVDEDWKGNRAWCILTH